MDLEKVKLNTGENKNPETLKTYMSDMADAVRENEMSVIKVAMAEQRARERGDYYRGQKESPKKKILFTLSGIVIIALALGLSYFLIKKNQEQNSPAEIITKENPLISYDKKVEIDATNISFRSDLLNALNKNTLGQEAGGVLKSIVLSKTEETGTETTLSAKELFEILKTTAPSSLIRSLSDNYFIGTYTPANNLEGQHLFLILELTDYNLVYANMLEWEKTIVSDLFPLFHINVSGNSDPVLTKTFKDIVIKNKDARILYDDNGEDILFYLFPDKNTLVITDNQDTIKEIIARLLIKQAQK